jgi:hypothetical protein
MLKSLALVLVASLGGCVAQPVAWVRADNTVATPKQRQLAETICKGEVQKAAATGGSVGTMDRLIGPDRQDAQIYAGCMAQQGYVGMSLR